MLELWPQGRVLVWGPQALKMPSPAWVPEKPFWVCSGEEKTVSHHGHISHSPLPLPASCLCPTQLWPWEAGAFAHRANIWYICELRDVKRLFGRNNDVPPWKSHKIMREGLGDKLQSLLEMHFSHSSAPCGLTVRDGRSTSAQVQLLPGQQAQIAQLRNPPELCFCCVAKERM